MFSNFSKWHTVASDYKVRNIVCICEEPTAPTRWPLARIIKVHPGQDGRVGVVTARTSRRYITDQL